MLLQAYSQQNSDSRPSESNTTSQFTMGSVGDGHENGSGKQKQILLNAFDMSTVGHLSPGQWKVSKKQQIFRIPMDINVDKSFLGP